MIFDLIGEIFKGLYDVIIFIFEMITAFFVMILAGLSP